MYALAWVLWRVLPSSGDRLSIQKRTALVCLYTVYQPFLFLRNATMPQTKASDIFYFPGDFHFVVTAFSSHLGIFYTKCNMTKCVQLKHALFHLSQRIRTFVLSNPNQLCFVHKTPVFVLLDLNHAHMWSCIYFLCVWVAKGSGSLHPCLSTHLYWRHLIKDVKCIST